MRRRRFNDKRLGDPDLLQRRILLQPEEQRVVLRSLRILAMQVVIEKDLRVRAAHLEGEWADGASELDVVAHVVHLCLFIVIVAPAEVVQDVIAKIEHALGRTGHAGRVVSVKVVVVGDLPAVNQRAVAVRPLDVARPVQALRDEAPLNRDVLGVGGRERLVH